MPREAPVTSAGPHYPLPYTGEGSWGLGKPLRSINGEPMIRHVHRLATQSGAAEVWIATDDDRIAAAARESLLHLELDDGLGYTDSASLHGNKDCEGV